MGKTLKFGIVALVLLALSMPAFAEVSLDTIDGQVGKVKGLQILGGYAYKLGGNGVIDVSNLRPEALDPVITIVATTDTGNTPPTGSTTTQTGTAAAKTGAFKISFTGTNGAQQTGWVRIYADGN
jgi:hypothetical protein